MRLSLAAAFAAFTLAAVPAHADLLIKVNKSTQQMTVSQDGQQLYVWPVSTGIARYDTPNGAYTPFRKEKEHFSKEWDDAPMPYSIFFTMQGHAIHGTNHSSLGRPASHGCVRLSVAHAAILWDLVAKEKMAHTTIVLTGKIPEEAPAVARARPQYNPGEQAQQAYQGYAAQQPQGYQAQQGYAVQSQQQDQDDQDGDRVASVPQRQQAYGRSGWAVDQYGRRYYYRERPQPDEQPRPHGFFPFLFGQ
ncbi:MAG TPA: L,D-transpeptidase [Pseudolabrys sp.]|nr:L,D-transpeptidase [Pseudolabrys sp.]